jgi:uncharacterized protein DUF5818
MRKVLLLVSVLLLGACWAVAQDSTNSNSSPASPTSASSGQTASTASGANTVEGCLSGSSGSYTLTAKDGTSYQLTGDTAKLSEHVGHTVKITGTSSAASSSAGGTATGTAGASSSSQTLEVSSVKHVSKTCQNGSMSK